MEYLLDWPIDINSLLVILAAPLLHLAWCRKFRNKPLLIQRGKWLFLCLCSILGLFVLAKCVDLEPSGDTSVIKFYLAHFAALVLAVLQISQIRTGPQLETNKNSDDSDFHPSPIHGEVEKLSWQDLVIDDKLRNELNSIISLLKDPHSGKKYGIEVPKGILLYGPPGTGKTTIAKVLANTAGLSFFNLRLDEVVSKWLGESERNLSKLFKAAKQHTPAVIFIDEVDSIARQRTGDSTSQWSENLLNHLLQMIDGVIKTEGLYIVAATNRADLVDKALTRGGRLNRSIEVPLPDIKTRYKLFELYMKKLNLGEPIDFEALSEVTEGKSCADIRAICNQAGLHAYQRESHTGGKQYKVINQDLIQALNEVE